MERYSSAIDVSTERKRQRVDITREAAAEVARSGVAHGICTLYAQGATAALMVQENDDPKLVPILGTRAR